MDQSIRDRYNDDILHELMRRYDIMPADIDRGDGFESFIYRFRRGDERFILRVTHSLRRTPELIRGEVDWINYLAAGGTNVAHAVVSARGELVEEVDDGAGGRFLATAFTFAPGRPYGETGWTTARRLAYGRLLGRMHTLTKAYEPSDLAWRRPSWIDNTEAETCRLLSADDSAIQERYRALVRRAKALPRGRDDYGLVHFDAHGGNFLIDGDTLTLFDFDDCAYNWFANDIAMVLFYLVSNVDDPAGTLDTFLPDFLRGYRAENALDPTWAALVPDFMTLREIDLYAIILRSYGVTPDQADTIPHAWPRRFMAGRREQIVSHVPYVEYEFGW